MDNLMCHYDEAYDKIDAKEIGWCSKCTIESCSQNSLDIKRIKIAKNWIDKNKKVFKHMTFSEKELIQIGKNIENLREAEVRT